MSIPEELLDYLNDAPQISDKIKAEIEKVGTPTGSWKFGGKAKRGSDRDVIMPPDTWIEWDDLMMDDFGRYLQNDYRHQHFDSIYVNGQDGRVYNLLLFRTDEASQQMYDAYIHATKQMIKLFKCTHGTEARAIFEDKTKRVAMFEALRDSFLEDYPPF
jgi:hypothetical protein